MNLVRSSGWLNERVARAPASGGILRKDATFDQVVDVAAGGILRALGEFRPLGRGELALEPIEQAVDDFLLPLVERLPGVRFPEPGFPKHAREGGLRSVEGAVEAAEEPLHPCCDIQRTLLGLFQDVVIVASFQSDLGRHAVEAFRALLGTCQGQIGDGAGDAPVPVVEGVDGDEPEMCLGGFEYWVDRRGAVEPFEELRHLRRKPVGWRVPGSGPVPCRSGLRRPASGRSYRPASHRP